MKVQNLRSDIYLYLITDPIANMMLYINETLHKVLLRDVNDYIATFKL